MPGIDYREARARIGMGEVLELIGFVPRTRVGDQLRGPCPVHGSHSPQSRSFGAHLGKGIWHCFVCKAGGNTLDLWSAVSRQALYPGVLELCDRLGHEVPWLPRPARRQSAKHNQERRSDHDHGKENDLMPEP